MSPLLSLLNVSYPDRLLRRWHRAGGHRVREYFPKKRRLWQVFRLLPYLTRTLSDEGWMIVEVGSRRIRWMNDVADRLLRLYQLGNRRTPFGLTRVLPDYADHGMPRMFEFRGEEGAICGAAVRVGQFWVVRLSETSQRAAARRVAAFQTLTHMMPWFRRALPLEPLGPRSADEILAWVAEWEALDRRNGYPDGSVRTHDLMDALRYLVAINRAASLRYRFVEQHQGEIAGPPSVLLTLTARSVQIVDTFMAAHGGCVTIELLPPQPRTPDRVIYEYYDIWQYRMPEYTKPSDVWNNALLRVLHDRCWRIRVSCDTSADLPLETSFAMHQLLDALRDLLGEPAAAVLQARGLMLYFPESGWRDFLTQMQRFRERLDLTRPPTQQEIRRYTASLYNYFRRVPDG